MSEVIVKKYMLTITTYPNGREYQTIYPIGKEQAVRREDAKTKKVEAQKRLELKKEEYKFEDDGDLLI